MRNTEVAIVGGGLAGSAITAMLGRTGIDAVLVDPHEIYPPDFRCEKLDRSQIALLEQTGFAEPVLSRATFSPEVWVARPGLTIDRRSVGQHNLLYDTLVNAIRSQIPIGTSVISGKVSGIVTAPDRQQVTLSTGESFSARVVVLANGLNARLRSGLGIEREELSRAHSISIGFDLAPVNRPAFDFPALTVYPDNLQERIAYLALFPIGATMRANLFVYRSLNDPWLKLMKTAPVETLKATFPSLARLMGDFAVAGDVVIRPVDLVASRNYRKPGVVVVGDAFATSCPAAGTGVGKALTDALQLCQVYIPRWLATPGMVSEKVGAFYEDPVKQSCDAASLARAFSLRSISTNPSPIWKAQRVARFAAHYGVGLMHRVRHAVKVADVAPSQADRF